MISTLAATFIFAVNCPSFGHSIPADWQGYLYIGGTVHYMPAPGIRMAVIAWNDQDQFVDAALCGEGDVAQFWVPEGTYYATIKFVGGEQWIRQTVPEVIEDPKPACYVACHQ